MPGDLERTRISSRTIKVGVEIVVLSTAVAVPSVNRTASITRMAPTANGRIRALATGIGTEKTLIRLIRTVSYGWKSFLFTVVGPSLVDNVGLFRCRPSTTSARIAIDNEVPDKTSQAPGAHPVVWEAVINVVP